MRKLLFAILLTLSATPAFAQNTQCANRPVGDSSNACANTRFVQATASGPITTTGPVTINPPSGTDDQGLIINQTGPNTGTIVANFAYNSIFVNGNALGANGPFIEASAFSATVATGGTNESGSIAAVFGLVSHNIATPANANKGDHIGGHFEALSTANDGGTDTGAGAAGTLFGGSLQARCGNGATFYFSCAGTENDVGILTGGSARYRFGTSTVDIGNLQAASLDAAYEFGSAGGPGFKTGLLLDNAHGNAPLSASGCVICTDGSANTIATGFDLSSYAISGTFLKGPNGFSVDGSGNVIVTDGTATGTFTHTSLFTHSIQIGTTTNHNFDFLTNNILAGYFDTNQQFNLGSPTLTQGVLNIRGKTSGAVSVGVQAAAGTYNWNMPITAGAAGSVLTSQGGGTTAMTWSAPGQLPATATNDNASAGNVGEFISSTIASGSAVSLTNATPANLTSISLTPGDWDVSCNISVTGATSTLLQFVAASINSTSATVSLTPGQFFQTSYPSLAAFNTGFDIVSNNVGPLRVSLASTTTYFCVADVGFTVSTASMYGIMRARRIR